MRGRRVLAAAALLQGVCAVRAAWPGEWLPDHKEVFPLLVADPRSAQFALRVYRSDGKTLAQGALGREIPFWRFESPGGTVIQAGLEASAFVRVSVSREGQNAALQTTDWFFGIPVEARRGPWAFRLWTCHTSSHLGDNFLITRGLTPITFSREAVEALAACRLPRLLLYAGGSHAIHTVPDVNGAALHGGAEISSVPETEETRRRFYAAFDLQPKGQADWRIQTNIQAGVALKGRSHATRLRLFIHYATGPSPEGQFFRSDQSFWSGGFGLDF